jgi:hypothetical protein
MSEHQSYEFLTLDRPLTAAAKKHLQQLSSRVEIKANKANFVYNYSNFPGNARDILAQYFDALFYIANFGTMELHLRLPKASVDVKAIKPYCREYQIELTPMPESYILSICYNTDDGGWWIDRDDYLEDLIELRQEILSGDYRLLYLAWLQAINGYLTDKEKSQLEPPIPPGLNQLSAALQAFVELYEIDPHLITAAATASTTLKTVTETELLEAIRQLPRSECDRFLLRVLHREPNVAIAVEQRLRKLRPNTNSTTAPQRTIEELLATAETARKDQQRRDREAQKAQKIKELEALASKEAVIWELVETSIARKNAPGYDLAVKSLIQLRDLANYQNQLPAFEAKIKNLCDRYSKRSALMERFKRAKLKF